MEQDDDKKREVLKWARKSEAADKVRQMEKEYDEQVEQFRKIIVEDQKMIKRRQQESYWCTGKVQEALRSIHKTRC